MVRHAMGFILLLDERMRELMIPGPISAVFCVSTRSYFKCFSLLSAARAPKRSF